MGHTKGAQIGSNVSSTLMSLLKFSFSNDIEKERDEEGVMRTQNSCSHDHSAVLAGAIVA